MKRGLSREISGIIVAVIVFQGLFFFALPLVSGKLNVGSLFGTAITLAIGAMWLLYPLTKRNKAVKIGYFAVVFLGLAGVGYAVFLTSKMIAEVSKTPEISVSASGGTENAPPLIIFGGKVSGGKPSAVLESRLEAGLEYLVKYPSAICIVSGGQGADEDSSEASVMRSWLLERGIDETRVYAEDKSTSTWENLKYSAEILSATGYDGKTFAAASDGFHLYRISLMSRELGYEATAVPSVGYPMFLPMYTVREWFALSAWFVGGRYE